LPPAAGGLGRRIAVRSQSTGAVSMILTALLARREHDGTVINGRKYGPRHLGPRSDILESPSGAVDCSTPRARQLNNLDRSASAHQESQQRRRKGTLIRRW